MKRNGNKFFLSILILFALLLTSCGSTNAESDTIATAVALTVAAQETQKAQAALTSTAVEASPTATSDAVDVTSTSISAATFAPPTAPGPISSGDPCLLANLISETIPDGTIMQPGDNFWKSWRLKNNGTCTWNSSYKIIYYSGDLMSGLLQYQFTDIVRPGEETDVTMLLKAPASNGNYTGNWKLQSEWGGQFGVGQYDQPFYVKINVNDSTNPNYGVTNVTYNIVRDPVAGCATNVWYRVHATITTNGPATVKYQWLQSDGNNSNSNPGPNKTLEFTQAESQTITREWSFHLGATPGTKWMQIKIHLPEVQTYPKATFVYDCQ